MDFRFDPILLTEKYTIDYHLEKFDMMCQWLHPYTTRCIFSFVDSYRGSPFREPEDEEKVMLAEGLSKLPPGMVCPCTPARRRSIWSSTASATLPVLTGRR